MAVKYIAVLTIKLHAPWVHSLKEKRMIVKSVVAKIQNKFQVSAAEVEDQDIHQSIVNFVEQCTEAEIVMEEREIR